MAATVALHGRAEADGFRWRPSIHIVQTRYSLPLPLVSCMLHCIYSFPDGRSCCLLLLSLSDLRTPSFCSNLRELGEGCVSADDWSPVKSRPTLATAFIRQAL